MSRSGRDLSGAGTTGLIITVRTNLRSTGTRDPGETPRRRLAGSRSNAEIQVLEGSGSPRGSSVGGERYARKHEAGALLAKSGQSAEVNRERPLLSLWLRPRASSKGNRPYRGAERLYADAGRSIGDLGQN
jgi:hypothetical protein